MNLNECLIWRTPADGVQIPNQGACFVDSPRCCGKYAIESHIPQTLGGDSIKAKLTTWIIDNRKGPLGIRVNLASLDQLASPAFPLITSKVIADVAKTDCLPPSKRAFRILNFLGDRTLEVGDSVRFADSLDDMTNFDTKEENGGCYVNPPPVDTFLRMLAWGECSRGKSFGELRFLLEGLKQEGLIKLEQEDDEEYKATVTLRGFMCIENGQL